MAEFIFPEYEEWAVRARSTVRSLGLDENLASRGNYGDLRDAIVGPLGLPPKRDYDQEERAAIVLANLRDASEEFLAGAAAFFLVMASSDHFPTRLVGSELAMAFSKLKLEGGKIAVWLTGELRVESDLRRSADALAEDASRVVKDWLTATNGEKSLGQWLSESGAR